MDNQIQCWDIYTTLSNSPTGEYVKISSIGGINCALDANGFSQCWSNYNSTAVTDMPINQDFLHISVGHGFVCGVKPDRSVTCWGGGDFFDQLTPRCPLTF